MSVGHVEERDPGEYLDYSVHNVLFSYDPERVPHAVGRGEVVLGFCGAHLLRDLRHPGHIPVGQEHGADLGVLRLDMPDPVELLVLPCELVLLYDVVLVVLDGCARDEPGLGVAGHDLPVEVERGGVVLTEDTALDHPPEVLGAAGVHPVVVQVHRRIEIDLGLGAVKDAPGVPGGHLPGLVRIEYVIGRGCDLLRHVLARS
ncbi:MAG: hypothetical protein BWX47_01843 [candidate division Hyd24-12 bacterium ADurb.Bin004]|nr:MAG: hypothetical protein BWX47_01843 [candidate division Hyd24-12 bacterium ADurb.Bin004]